MKIIGLFNRQARKVCATWIIAESGARAEIKPKKPDSSALPKRPDRSLVGLSFDPAFPGTSGPFIWGACEAR
jgi:hypothetical protein